MNSKINNLFGKYIDGVPGISVLAGDKDGIFYKNNFGLANLEYNIKLTEKSVFNLASVSKPMTASGILLLAEKGALSIEDELIRYFPEFDNNYKGIKIKHLLNHTSGIPNYYDILRSVNKDSCGFTNADFYKLMMEHPVLEFKPGDRFEYSNSGYVFLSLIIERVTNQSFSQFMNEHIFRPLGMKNSYVYTERKPVISNLAYSYNFEEGDYYCDYTLTYTLGDGGIFSSMLDVYTLIQNLLDSKVVSEKSWNSMIISQKTDKGIEIPYGYGWEIGDEDNNKIIYHSGLDAGYRNLVTIYPDNNLIIILLSNNGSFTYKERKDITRSIKQIYTG